MVTATFSHLDEKPLGHLFPRKIHFKAQPNTQSRRRDMKVGYHLKDQVGLIYQTCKEK